MPRNPSPAIVQSQAESAFPKLFMVIVVLFSGGDFESTEWIESFAALKIIYFLINGPVYTVTPAGVDKKPLPSDGKISILYNFTFFIKR